MIHSRQFVPTGVAFLTVVSPFPISATLVLSDPRMTGEISNPSAVLTSGQQSIFLFGMSHPCLSFARPSDTANLNTRSEDTSKLLPFKLAISTTGA